MAEFTGPYGTRFVFREHPHSDLPIFIERESYVGEVPCSDLVAFLQEVKRRADEAPIDLTEKVQRYIQAAIDASVEHEKEKVKVLTGLLDQYRKIFADLKIPSPETK